LDKKSKPLICVGYCEDIRAYQLLNLCTYDVFFCTNIHFNERIPTHSYPTTSSYLVSHEDSFFITLDILNVVITPVNPPNVAPYDVPTRSTFPISSRIIIKEEIPFI